MKTKNNQKSDSIIVWVYIVGVIGLIFLFFSTNMGEKNMLKHYVGTTYNQIVAENYETPFENVTLNRDNTVTVAYKNQTTTIPGYITGNTFSFTLPDNTQYTAIIEDKPLSESIRSSKQKDDLFGTTTSTMIITNDAGFCQILSDKENGITTENYPKLMGRFEQNK